LSEDLFFRVKWREDLFFGEVTNFKTENEWRLFLIGEATIYYGI